MEWISTIFKGITEGVVGPLFGWLNKKEDVKLEEFKVDGKVDTDLLNAHVAALKARRDVLIEGMKYRGIRMCQYGVMVPWIVHWVAIVVYCILSPYYPAIQVVKALPPDYMYIGSAIVGFLLLSSKIDDWKRKT